MKVGILGAGFILKSHAEAIASIPGVTLTAVADSSLSRAQRAASTFHIGSVFRSVEEMAASDCDIVHILLPPPFHEEAAETILRSGKSVFLEKPMGLDSAACLRLADVAGEVGRKIGVNHNFLFTRGYEHLRHLVKSGELGRIDQLHVNWHSFLPQLEAGPFDAWLVSAPSNVLFELAPHLIAFILDLLSGFTVRSVDTGCWVTLPTEIQVPRHWSITGHGGATNVIMSLSVTKGQTDRFLRLRGSAGSAQHDFGRDLVWYEKSTAENPTLEAHSVLASAGWQIRRRASADRRRRLISAIRKRPDSAPFEESIFRSIKAFYARLHEELDPRHSAAFGARVISVCEQIVAAVGTGKPSRGGLSVMPPKAATKPTVLVVGGTGFIGRKLVRALVQREVSVRVLTRSMAAAAIEFQGVPVELIEGSHGRRDDASRALEGIQTVYHLAKAEGKRWLDYVEGDVQPTRILAEEALKAGVSRFIYTGTVDSYSSGDPRTRIDSSTPIDRRIASRNLYARSKAECEALLWELHRTRGLPLVVFRPGIVIGPGSPPQHVGVARFTSETEVEYWGDGANKLPFVLVDDVTDALVSGHFAHSIEGETFLLTSDPLLSAADYLTELSALTGLPINARPRAAWKHWLPDALKELVKKVIRHPNHRKSTWHDWACRSHRSTYDSSYTKARLHWTPAATKSDLVLGGIAASVQQDAGCERGSSVS